MLGFVFADSRRRTNTDLLRAVKDIPVLKIAVVTEAPDGELVDAWKDGLIDAFQYHGDESPGECLRRGLPFYKALRLREPGEAGLIMDYSVARVLVDAWVPGHAGGTGRQLSPELVDAAAGQKPLWLAGGLNPENIAEILEKHRPELIDASSGLEAEPGRKDPVLMKRYFEEIAGASV